MPPRAFEGDHYDVPQERYDALVAAGARPVEGKELVRILLASGLRIQKRKGERVILSRRDADWMPPPNRFDVIVSTQPHPPPATVLVRLLVLGPRASVALAHRRDGGLDLPAATVAEGETPMRALAALVARTVCGATPATLLGYARNTVLHPDPTGYRWPVPQAAFVVFRCTAGPRVAGRRGPGVARAARRRARVPHPALVAALHPRDGVTGALRGAAMAHAVHMSQQVVPERVRSRVAAGPR